MFFYLDFVLNTMDSKQTFSDNEIIEAVYYGDLEKIKQFNEPYFNITSKKFMGDKRPLVFDALNSINSIEVLKIFIENKVNINCKDNGFPPRTLIMHAIKFSSINIIKLLVENGVEINNIPDSHDGDFPISIVGTALFYKRFEIVNYLLENIAIFFNENEKKVIMNYIS